MKQKHSGSAQKTLLAMYQAMRKRWGHQGWWPASTRLEMMVGAILTQNTAWSNVEKALANLQAAGLLPSPDAPATAAAREIQETACAQRMHAALPAGLAPHLTPAGYFNVKAQRLWNLLDWFVTGYGGRFAALEPLATATLRQELLAVKGVGTETADSILLYALEREAFVIDAYTHRVFKRHDLAPANATYEDLQKLAVDALPRNRDLWNDYHAQLVMVGKEFCKPTPRCQTCPLRPFLKDSSTGP